ncbi:MAG TPA: hypothetical protein VF170_07265, partial [Planctomycetaceae bacterium]
MSVMNRHGRKVLLPRHARGDAFWEVIREAYAGEDAHAWRRLAMLALKETAGWPIERIAATFGRDARHVARCVSETKSALRERLRPE